ncbi:MULTISPECIES: oligosaccharide flippase family protein [Acinetobacter]|uniref:oligosaccharide flippase family protein n=1 Tax=Acinetobacter TaxID=469 RepID=UPI000F66A342|nr:MULTISPECIES: oligosaccharide flippase family protein [Acinetobacter]RSC22471.1 polysaccharide biosynthesis protein [Acinetobacter sp. FDAARGOS_515]VTX53442.1 Polysaccharide biosynthesis protein [Acinetobacter ursingii]
MNFLKLKDKVFINSIWIMFEKILALFGLIFITSFLAKYIGPENFGKLSFATTLFAMVQTISIWGTDVVCSKRISQKHDSGLSLLLSISVLRGIIFFLTSIPLLLYMWFEVDSLSFIFAIAVGAATYITIQDIYILYNDVTLKAIYNVFANIIGLLVSLGLRFVIAYYELDPVYLVLPIILIALIPFFIRRAIFIKKTSFKIKKLSYRHKINYSKYVFISGFSLVLSAVAITIYVNISQFLLGIMVSKTSLGVFAVAVTLGGAWSFVNLAFLTSFTPRLYQSKNEIEASENTTIIIKIMLLFSLLYIVFFYFFGKFFINKLYGSAYISAFEISLILIMATIFSNFGQVYARYMFLFNGFKYLMYKTFFLMVFGVILAYILISKYQIFGAAYTILIVEFLSLTLFNYFFRNFDVLKAQATLFGFVRKEK